MPNTIKSYLGVRYLTLNKYDTQTKSYVTLYSAASPSVAVDQILNFGDHLIMYFGIGNLYLDVLQLPNFIMQNREFHLFKAHIGIEYSTKFKLYFQNEYSIGQDLIYQLQGNNNTLQDQTVYIMNDKILAGYTFFKIGTMKAQVESAYLLTVPLQNNISSLGNGYEGALKVSQQNSGYAIGARLFYANRITNTSNVKSNVSEFGIIGELSLELGYQ